MKEIRLQPIIRNFVFFEMRGLRDELGKSLDDNLTASIWIGVSRKIHFTPPHAKIIF